MTKNLTGQALIDQGLISPAQLNIALMQQKLLRDRGEPRRIGEILRDNAFITRMDLDEALAERVMEGGARSAVRILSRDTCLAFDVVPIDITHGALRIKTTKALSKSDLDLLLIEARQEHADIQSIQTLAATKAEVQDYLGQLDSGAISSLVQMALDQQVSNPDNGTLLKNLMQSIFLEALGSRASDIHLVRTDNPLKNWVGYRVDGILKWPHLIPIRSMQALFMRIKSDCGMDASESRRPQDGRLDFVDSIGQRVDIRVSAQPSDGGESLVMRLLDPRSLKSLTELLPAYPEISSRLQMLVRTEGKTGGVSLITGPTGSGKSTTLYALIQAMPRHSRKVATVEDPVEYQMPFTQQIQVNTTIGLTFSAILKSLLRQDPDILVLGETRDAESAAAMLQFGESGHKVYTTLHTSSVEDSIGRLLNMVSPESRKETAFILGRYLSLVMNQQLARRLCSCAVAATKEHLAEYAKFMADHHISPAGIKQPMGCPLCNKTGTFGRALVPEVFFIDNQEKARGPISSILQGPAEGYGKLFTVPGTFYFSRRMAVDQLLSQGLIGLSTAQGVMGEASH